MLFESIAARRPSYLLERPRVAVRRALDTHPLQSRKMVGAWGGVHGSHKVGGAHSSKKNFVFLDAWLPGRHDGKISFCGNFYRG